MGRGGRERGAGAVRRGRKRKEKPQHELLSGKSQYLPQIKSIVFASRSFFLQLPFYFWKADSGVSFGTMIYIHFPLERNVFS